MFQSFQLLANLTARENVLLPLELQSSPEAAKRAAELLDQVGLEDRGHHYPVQLSGGEQQRVALARAFATSPLASGGGGSEAVTTDATRRTSGRRCKI